MKGLSVIITAYKTSSFIEECLDSVYMSLRGIQRHEVVVGIDGCKKTTKKLAEISRKYENLRVFINRRNVGTYVTTNSILKRAKYNTILRFDSDDIAIEGSIFEYYNVVKYIVKDIPFCMIPTYTQYNKVKKKSIGVVFYNKALISKIGGYKEYRVACDTDILMRARQAGAFFINKDKILFYRRVREDSLTRCKQTEIRSKYRTELYKKFTREKAEGIIKIKPKTTRQIKLSTVLILLDFFRISIDRVVEPKNLGDKIVSMFLFAMKREALSEKTQKEINIITKQKTKEVKESHKPIRSTFKEL